MLPNNATFADLYAQIDTGRLLRVFNRGPALLRNVLEGLTHEHLLELYTGHRERHMERFYIFLRYSTKLLSFNCCLSAGRISIFLPIK
ncbi:MAG: hypothetical protein E2O79_10040 [Caldithrix sp.]|nr:MAG: hypothetical protein E2O79_10040 [Caldithrix sp.]